MWSVTRDPRLTMPPKRQKLIEDTDETLGQRLARLRKERGVSQEQLAAQLKISQASVSDYENDRLRLHADVIIAITKMLGVSTDLLLGQKSPSTIAVKDRRLLQRMALIERLPKRDRDALLRTINAFLAARAPH